MRPSRAHILPPVHIVCLGLLICITAGAVPVPVSLLPDGEGVTGHSGGPNATDGRAPVANDGRVVFLTEAPLELADTGTDWDVYRRTVDGALDVISRARAPWSGGQAAGQAWYLTAVGDTVVEVRDDALFNPTTQYLIRRDLNAPVTPAFFATGSDAFARPRLSGDGLMLVFEASDNGTVVGDEPGLTDIYRQLFSPPLPPALISVRGHTPAAPLAGDCTHPAANNDASRIVFQSIDNRLVADDTNDVIDVFLWEANTITRVSLRPDGSQTEAPSEQPVISADGQTILFASRDSGLVDADTNGAQDVFAHSLSSGVTRRISLNSNGGESDADAHTPEPSADGRFVVFLSSAGNFPGARDGIDQVYLYDLLTDRLECLSLNDQGAGADADCLSPAISPNGRYITFASAAANFADGTGGYRQIYLIDRGVNFANTPPFARNVSAVCQKNDGQTHNACTVQLDADDAESAAGALTFRLLTLPGASGTLVDAGAQTVTTETLVTTAALPLVFEPAVGFTGTITLPYQASDGSAWSDTAAVTIVVTDTTHGLLQVASRSDTALGDAPGNAESPTDFGNRDVSVSDDGRWIAFAGDATDLTATGEAGVFLRDTASRRTHLLTGMFFPTVHFPRVAPDGSAVSYIDSSKLHWLALGDDGPSGETVNSASFSLAADLALSRDGSVVLFSTKTDAATEDTDGAKDVYRWRPATNVVDLVSRGGAGEQTDSACTQPAISADGRWAAFLSGGVLDGGDAPDSEAVWVKSLETGAVTRVTDAAGDAAAPSLSWTGRFLCYTVGTTAKVLDLWQSEGNREVAAVTGVANASLSANGRYLFFTSTRTDLSLVDQDVPAPDGTHAQAFRYELSTGMATPLSYTDAGYADADVTGGTLTGTGRHALFMSAAGNLPGSTEGTRQVYHMDLFAGDNAVPAAAPIAAETLEDEPSPALLLTGADLDGNDVVCEIVTPPTNGTLSALQQPTPGSTGATLVYTPADNFAGNDTFTYRCTDYEGAASAVGTVTVTVEEVNDVPEWTNTPLPQQVAEESETRLDLRPYVTDPDTANAKPDSLTFAIVGGTVPGWAVIDPANGHDLLLTPGYDVASNSVPSPGFELVLQVTDSRSDAVMAPGTVTVTVENLDRPPVLTLVSLTPETARTVHNLTATPIMTDPDGDTPTPEFRWYRNDMLQQGLNSATLLAAATAKDETWHAEARAVAFGLASEWIASPARTIENTPPEIVQPDPQTTAEDTDGDIEVTVSDVDAGEPLGLTFSQPANGSVALLNRRGTEGVFTLRFSPDLDYFSPDGVPETFTIQASDGNDNSPEAIVTVTVEARNDPPVLTVDGLLRLAPGAATADISVSAGDGSTIRVADVDNDPLEEVTLVIIAGPVQGTLSGLTAGTVGLDQALTNDDYPLTYTAGENAVNSDWFMVKAVDAGGAESVPATLLLDLGFQASEVHLSRGWNLVSLPLVTGSAAFVDLFFDTATGEPAFVGPVWEWDPVSRSYRAAQTAWPFTAYWLFCPVAPLDPILVTGVATAQTEGVLGTGWNLVGPVGPGETGDVAWPLEAVHAWTGTDYAPPPGNRLQRNQGYWFFSDELTPVDVDVYLPPPVP